MMRIGLLGCGNIGHIIAKHQENFEILALYDLIPEKAYELADISGGTPFEDFNAFIQADFDLVVEAASVRAVRQYGSDIISSGKDIVIMSVGALSDTGFRSVLTETATRFHRKIYIPSGAVMGLDNIKIGQISGLRKLLLKTTKSPESLGLVSSERRLIFSGKAHECIKEFPKNVNVSVALSLAAGREADVELWIDPDVDRNIHEIFVEGDFGDACIRVRNLPSPENPSTSYLAALSILTLLRNIDNPLVIGT
ncbi:MAG TPA: aspartate dehydrogenase [Methanoregulaceae archaeon]|nr:aspartate dehydrogenase [Methanoregulaceae archaeon]